MPIKFAFNEQKAVAALAFVASETPGQTPFFVSKILFYADKKHVNRYGRPILGDNYVKMEDGPVPSTVKNYFDEKWERVPKPVEFDRVLTIKKRWYRHLYVGQHYADMDLLSESDKRCLLEAIEFCKGKSKDKLSELTHLERAWLRAPDNRYMDYLDFVDEDHPHKEEVIELMKENAYCGIL